MQCYNNKDIQHLEDLLIYILPMRSADCFRTVKLYSILISVSAILLVQCNKSNGF